MDTSSTHDAGSIMLDSSTPSAPLAANASSASLAESQVLLFEDTESSSDAPDSHAADTNSPFTKRAPRVNRPERFQAEFRFESLDQRVDENHPVRLVWAFVESLDLSELFDRVKAVEGNVGRNVTDFRVLFALLLFAVIDGVASAREIARLTEEHIAYEWLRGGVPLNYHMISDFRVQHGELLDRLFTESLASLSKEGLIDLKTTAQDGMKVRAWAGSSSYRREGTLAEHLEIAKKRVEEMREQAEDPQVSARQKAARQRAAREKVERLEAALENHKKFAADREHRKKGDGATTRTSTTEPEARKMKMADGGFRPAHNVQFNSTTENKFIVGVDVTNQGSDFGLMPPMLEQTEARLGALPENHLGDGNFSSKEDIEKTTQMGPTVYTPIKEEKKILEEGGNPYEPKKKDSPEVAAWRARMGTPLAKEIYKLRGETAEWVNAGMRNRGMNQFLVRGTKKVKAVVLWYVLAHNLMRAESVRARKRESGEIPCAG